MQRIMCAQQWVVFLYKGDDALQRRIKAKMVIRGSLLMLFSAIVGSVAPNISDISSYWFCSTCHVTPYELPVKYILYWQLSQGNILETFTILHLASNFVLAQESSVVLETTLIPLVMRRQLNNKQQNNKINQKIINMIQECAFIHGKGRNQLTINLIFLCFPRAKPRLNLQNFPFKLSYNIS